MTVEVKLHDFCGDGCPWFELMVEPAGRTLGGEWVGGGLTCEHYGLCKSVADRIKAQKGDTHDA